MAMSAIEVETMCRSIADQAKRVGLQLRLDYWKLELLGLSQKDIWRIRDNLKGIVELSLHAKDGNKSDEQGELDG